MDNEKKTAVCRILYGVILLAASLPLVCGYILESEENLIWIRRIEAIAEGLRSGGEVLFPSAEALAGGGEIFALNSNLWLLIPALIRVLGGSMTAAWIIFMLMINSITLYSSVKMFGRLFEDKLVAMFGVLLFMTCPYRVWLCYNVADLGKAAAWMLVPLFLWAMQGICSGDGNGMKWKEILIASIALAGIGYADSIMLLAAAGCAALEIVWYRKTAGVLPILMGGCLYLPGAVYLMRYLIRGGMEAWNLPIRSIVEEGYLFRHFFTSFVFLDGKPGLGLGVFGALLALMWLLFAGDGGKIMKKYGFYVVLSLLFLILSLSYFPWELVQRIGAVFLRLVSLFDIPGIFFGYASFFLCVPAAYGVGVLFRQEKKFVRIGIPLMILTAALGVTVYLCNDLTFMRLPL